MRLVDTQTHDDLVRLAAQIVLRYGNNDVRLWRELEAAVTKSWKDIDGNDNRSGI